MAQELLQKLEVNPKEALKHYQTKEHHDIKLIKKLSNNGFVEAILQIFVHLNLFVEYFLQEDLDTPSDLLVASLKQVCIDYFQEPLEMFKDKT